MPLPPGSRVGIYEVVELIGVGGMGEVYRATDSRLDRAVAIKTLPVEFAADPDRLARFEREAKLLAQLNHPHIASIYGIEPGTPVALAMEMAEGETLADRIRMGPLDLDDALLIAKQIAEGLEHAHAKGIVHRDLKPANIKIGAVDGKAHVKILDFGLAKAMSNDASASSMNAVSSPTITSPANLTRAGVVLGTAAYMAPEQARGRFVDHRADIWAFGCVFYEMLTGHRSFDGIEVADALAKVIQSDPDWSSLPSHTPTFVRRLLRRCLHKDPHQRFHSIADVRIELEDADADRSMPSVTPRARPVAAIAVAAAAFGAALTAAVLIGIPSRVTPVATPVYRFDIAPPPGWGYFRIQGNSRLSIALSPDGAQLAAVLVNKSSNRRIFVRRFDDGAFREVPGTEGASILFWSPDSTKIGFGLAGTSLRVADVAGGGSRPLASVASAIAATWSSSGNIVVARSDTGSLAQFTVNAATPVPLDQLPKGVLVRTLPRWMLDGRRLIVADVFGFQQGMLKLRNVDGSFVDLRPFESVGGGSMSFELSGGYVLMSTTEQSGRTVLTAQKIDEEQGTLLGSPQLVATDLNAAFTATPNGILAFGDNQFLNDVFTWMGGKGHTTEPVTDTPERITNFDLSPDERFVVYQSIAALKLRDLVRGVTTTLAPAGTDPIFSPDGASIAFTNATPGGGIYTMPVFGGTPRVVMPITDAQFYTEDWSSDGRSLVIVARGGDAYLLSTAGNEPRVPLHLAEDGEAVDETHFSPDGHWLAYARSKQGTVEVYLTALPPTGERWQLSVGGGTQPRWRKDGRAVYYMAMNGDLKEVELSTAVKPPSIQPATTVLATGVEVQATLDQYAVSKQGRFLVRRAPAGIAPASDLIHVIVNWPNVLKTSQ